MGDRLEWLRELREAKAKRLESEQESVTHPKAVTKIAKPVTKMPLDVTKIRADVTKVVTRGKGRPTVGDKAMTAAERMRLMRAKRRPPRAD